MNWGTPRPRAWAVLQLTPTPSLEQQLTVGSLTLRSPGARLRIL